MLLFTTHPPRDTASALIASMVAPGSLDSTTMSAFRTMIRLTGWIEMLTFWANSAPSNSFAMAAGAARSSDSDIAIASSANSRSTATAISRSTTFSMTPVDIFATSSLMKAASGRDEPDGPDWSHEPDSSSPLQANAKAMRDATAMRIAVRSIDMIVPLVGCSLLSKR